MTPISLSTLVVRFFGIAVFACGLINAVSGLITLSIFNYVFGEVAPAFPPSVSTSGITTESAAAAAWGNIHVGTLTLIFGLFIIFMSNRMGRIVARGL